MILSSLHRAKLPLSAKALPLLCSGAFLGLLAQSASAQTQTPQAITPLAYSGGTYTQDFNSLASTGSTASSGIPSGFGFVKVGTSATATSRTYGVGTGSSNSGNVYSFGSANSTDRAFGGLTSSAVSNYFGFIFQNTSGTSLSSFTVTYTGEQWRDGGVTTTAANSVDRLDFQYQISTAATLDALPSTGYSDPPNPNNLATPPGDFDSPTNTSTTINGTSGIDGNASANRTPISVTVTPSTPIAPNSFIIIRFVDTDATGADDGIAVDDFTFLGTAAPTTPPSTPGSALISEFRPSGPAGDRDEFVELYNTSATSSLDVSNWKIISGAGTGTIVSAIGANTSIPARGHLLLAGTGYTTNGVTSTGSIDVDVPASTRIALIDGNNTVIDEVTPPVAPASATDEYSYVRVLTSGVPQDTNSDSSDFILVATNATAGTGAGPRIGAPGAEGSNSPIQRNATIAYAVADPASSATTGQNFLKSTTPATNGPLGTISLRRKITNNTGQTITSLRFRAVDITAGTAAAGTANARLLSSNGTTITLGGVPTPVLATTLDTPPTQPNGGGLNSTVSVALPNGSLAPNGVIYVEFLLGFTTGGSYRAAFNLEANTTQ